MTDPNITIRQLAEHEIEIFRRIRLETLSNDASSFSSRYEDWVNRPDSDWRDYFKDAIFVAFNEDDPVGVVRLCRQSANMIDGIATLKSFYVRECYRGTGLAREILNKIIYYASVNNIKLLELSVNDKNFQAIRFYKRNSFEERRDVEDCFVDVSKNVDIVWMFRRIL